MIGGLFQALGFAPEAGWVAMVGGQRLVRWMRADSTCAQQTFGKIFQEIERVVVVLDNQQREVPQGRST